jgi:hypothetical protein
MLDAVNIEWEPSFNHTENNLRTMYTKTDIHLESKPEPIAERPKSTGISAYDQLCKILDESD